jgi:hypothetical protein
MAWLRWLGWGGVMHQCCRGCQCCVGIQHPLCGGQCQVVVRTAVCSRLLLSHCSQWLGLAFIISAPAQRVLRCMKCSCTYFFAWLAALLLVWIVSIVNSGSHPIVLSALL